MVKVGILSLQGSVIEHRRCLERLGGVEVIETKTQQALQTIDGLILPGGESTTIGKLLNQFGLMNPLRRRILDGMPVWGTCAGLILLAKHIVNEPVNHLNVMDITVRRNAYGSQLDSFTATAHIPAVSPADVPLVFIRAPWIEAAGEHVEVLYRHEGQIVAARENNMLATSFHPELTEDLSFHRYFVRMITEQQ